MPLDDETRLIRARIDHEDGLLAQRTTWVMTSQAFLFTAYALCATRPLGGATPSLEVERLRVLLPWAAIASLALLYVTIAGGLREMARLHRALAGAAATFGELQARRSSRAAGLAAPVGIPGVFLAEWLALIAARS